MYQDVFGVPVYTGQVKMSTIWKPKVKEGDMIIFPSCIDHFAPMCESEDPRTVIAFTFDQTG